MKEKIRFAGGKEKMPPKKQKQFSTRQLMDAPDFEVFHYMDAHPVDVDYHSHDFYEIYFIIFCDIFIVKIRLNDVTKCKHLKLF